MNPVQNVNYQVLDCMGNELETGCFENNKWEEIEVPTAGMVIFDSYEK